MAGELIPLASCVVITVEKRQTLEITAILATFLAISG
jgi:hypothetical protein